VLVLVVSSHFILTFFTSLLHFSFFLAHDRTRTEREEQIKKRRSENITSTQQLNTQQSSAAAFASARSSPVSPNDRKLENMVSQLKNSIRLQKHISQRALTKDSFTSPNSGSPPAGTRAPGSRPSPKTTSRPSAGPIRERAGVPGTASHSRSRSEHVPAASVQRISTADLEPIKKGHVVSTTNVTSTTSSAPPPIAHGVATTSTTTLTTTTTTVRTIVGDPVPTPVPESSPQLPPAIGTSFLLFLFLFLSFPTFFNSLLLAYSFPNLDTSSLPSLTKEVSRSRSSSLSPDPSVPPTQLPLAPPASIQVVVPQGGNRSRSSSVSLIDEHEQEGENARSELLHALRCQSAYIPPTLLAMLER
jgi:hypothetical protein